MTKLHTSVDERTTDPDRWHPGLRRKVREWAETRIFPRRGAPIYPTREARATRPMPRAAVRALTGKAAA